jgi:hypothetical protein
MIIPNLIRNRNLRFRIEAVRTSFKYPQLRLKEQVEAMINLARSRHSVADPGKDFSLRLGWPATGRAADESHRQA